MAADRVQLDGGYESGLADAKGLSHDGGDGANNVRAKQVGLTGDLQGGIKGSFASQIVNNSTATANTHSAFAAMHSSNAVGQTRFLRDVGHAEGEAHDSERAESTLVDTEAVDLLHRIQGQGNL